jgi:hypothetical protein
MGMFDDEKRAEGNMDFIERIFGVSPDGGNGTLEAVYFIVIGLVTFWILRRRLGRLLLRRSSRPPSGTEDGGK